MTLPALLLAQAASLTDHAPAWLWLTFIGVMGTLIALDLFVFNREAHVMRLREAVAWTVAWVTLALLFGAGVFAGMDSKKGSEFLSGYVVEICLSVDNLFVFLVIFTYFGVRPEHQPRVLSWGIFGAIVLRMVCIFLGTTLLASFHWLLYVFGAILVWTGIKLLRGESEMDPENSKIIVWTKKLLPVTKEFHGQKFFVRRSAKDSSAGGGEPGVAVHVGAGQAAPAAVETVPAKRGRLVATPLFLVLVVIDFTDIVFAVDSVPAILGLTKDPFIAFTSNVFAISGLRAMYFVLTAFLDKFHYLKYGLSVVLIFIGVKMLVEHWFKLDPFLALLVVVAILGTSVVLSLLFPPKRRPLEPEADHHAASGDDEQQAPQPPHPTTPIQGD